MLKNIRLLILIGLIMPISTISIQPAARAATEFCNQTNSPVRVAYARGTIDPRPSIEIINYQIKGWLTINPIALTSKSDPSAQSKIKSFVQWCQEKDTLSIATARTIDVLLKQAKTQNCKSADSILGKLTELNIREGKISDLRPIAGLKNLTILNLDQNQIVDLAPLSNLRKLTTLSLSINKIVNVSPLADLSNLKSLNLMANNVRDVKSLAKLKKLIWLQLSDNPISYGSVGNRVCPIAPASNCVWIYE